MYALNYYIDTPSWGKRDANVRKQSVMPNGDAFVKLGEDEESVDGDEAKLNLNVEECSTPSSTKPRRNILTIL